MRRDSGKSPSLVRVPVPNAVSQSVPDASFCPFDARRDVVKTAKDMGPEDGRGIAAARS